ncbi:MAG: succinate dehydrogenase assembly factor 2, partial [Pseudomonadota bacterium]|nr:succinate dehydrogenase assembly factor 2 [Pseudomonadota bacterium]
LDILLQHYLEYHYQQASLKEQQQFQTLLTYSDHQLYAYLIAHQHTLDAELAHLIKKIKRFKD